MPIKRNKDKTTQQGDTIEKAFDVGKFPPSVSEEMPNIKTKEEKSQRDWRFVFNNWTENDYNKIRNLDSYTYLIIGKEIAPTTGTPHLQGYIQFKRPQNFEYVRTSLSCDVRKCDADDTANYRYCAKDGCFEEFGIRSYQGKRNDLESIKQLVIKGAPAREIWLSAKSFQALKFAEAGRPFFNKKREKAPRVEWWWGPTGTGKTKRAVELYPNAWFSDGTLDWWQDYIGQTEVIIDDFREHFCKFSTLLRYLDRYQVRVMVKGGSFPLMAEVIIITSCFHPEHVYSDMKISREDVGQLIRRLTNIAYFNGETIIYESNDSLEVGGNNTPRPQVKNNPHRPDNIAIDDKTFEELGLI